MPGVVGTLGAGLVDTPVVQVGRPGPLGCTVVELTSRLIKLQIIISHNICT